MALSPLDLVKSGQWDRAVFTTYALSLSFFEGVVLDALVRGRNREALILADVVGVQSALSEQGVRRAGRDYEVEPVHVRGGCFHPKVSVFSNIDDVHVLVGSGNLTFGGWGNNLEIVEHLHPTFAPEAIRDVADFFDQIATAPRLSHGSGDRCADIADDLRRRTRGLTSDGSIRVISSLENSIVEQIEQLASDLGPAEQLVVASPFWDVAGAGIDELCRRLKLDVVQVHSHPSSTVRSAMGINWPWTTATKVMPVTIQHFVDNENERLLHAKAYEIRFAKGRVLVSGSANATYAALGKDRNVEACVVRIQRDRTSFWGHCASLAPERASGGLDDEEDASVNVGVLRASLEGDLLKGAVLTGLAPGPATAFLVKSDGIETIGTLQILPDGLFKIRAVGMEIEAWNAGRAIIRLVDDEARRAEGFVSLTAFSAVIRRTGAIGRSLMALISMTETPKDIAAVMEWLHDNPDRYPREVVNGGGTGVLADRPEMRILILSDILNEQAPALDSLGSVSSGDAQGAARFIEMLLAAFRTPMRAKAAVTSDYVAEEDYEENTVTRTRSPVADEPERERAFAHFSSVLDAMLARGSNEFLVAALELTLFMCDRLAPGGEIAREWLTQIERRSPPSGFPSEGRPLIGAAVIAMAAAASSNPVITRGRLLKLGYNLNGPAPNFDDLSGIAFLAGGADPEAFLALIQASRSLPEQNRAFLDQVQGRVTTGDYPALRADTELWRILKGGLTEGPTWNRAIEIKSQSTSCPRCHIGLPIADVYRLRNRYAAKAENCCGRILLKTVP